MHAKAVLLRTLLAGQALLAIWSCWTPSRAAASDQSPERTVAVIRPGPIAVEPLVEVSADRNVLYVVAPKAGPSGTRPGQVAETELTIYDVTEPRSPRRLSVLSLGNIDQPWLAVARNERLILQQASFDPKRTFGVMVVDVHDPSRPTITGNVAVNGRLALSRDGTTAQITPNWPETKLTTFKLDRPDRPLDRPVPDDELAPDLDMRGRSSEPFEGPFGRPRDQSGDRLLVDGGGRLHVLALTRDAAPQRLLSVPINSYVEDARWLSERSETAVVFGPDGIRIMSLKPSTLEAARLKTTHARLLADYPGELKKLLAQYADDPGAARSLENFYVGLAVTLEDAGVRDLLLDAKAGSVPETARVAVLNDYGFWLSKSSDPVNAVAVLRKVVALAPARAVARLNLGDAARSALAKVPTWAEKTAFVQIGLQAYADYRELTGRDAPAAHEFELLHGGGAVTNDVCTYVAAFYDHGRQSELWGYPDPVDIAGNGKLLHIYISSQGTAHVPVIVTTRERKSLDEIESAVQFDNELGLEVPPEVGWTAEPHVLPFKTGYFVVYEEDDGPSAVVKPNGGTVCRFKRGFTPVLVEDHAPAICRKALAGTTFERVSRQKLPGDGIKIESEDFDLVHTDAGGARIAEFSDAKLDPNDGPARLGYFEVSSGAGRGCDVNGVLFLNGDVMEKSLRATALIDVQHRTINCAGDKASVILADGEILIEIDRGLGVQQTVPPRLLLRERGDRFETVCRVAQRQSFETR
jgi:hypothetical protein